MCRPCDDFECLPLLLLNNVSLLSILLCAFLCGYVHMSADGHGVQKKALDNLHLELQELQATGHGAGNQTQVP